jgi:hypothetical protein
MALGFPHAPPNVPGPYCSSGGCTLGEISQRFACDYGADASLCPGEFSLPSQNPFNLNAPKPPAGMASCLAVSRSRQLPRCRSECSTAYSASASVDRSEGSKHRGGRAVPQSPGSDPAGGSFPAASREPEPDRAPEPRARPARCRQRARSCPCPRLRARAAHRSPLRAA